MIAGLSFKCDVDGFTARCPEYIDEKVFSSAENAMSGVVARLICLGEKMDGTTIDGLNYLYDDSAALWHDMFTDWYMFGPIMIRIYRALNGAYLVETEK